MIQSRSSRAWRVRPVFLTALSCALIALAGCKGDRGPAGPSGSGSGGSSGSKTSTTLQKADDAPGIVVKITGLSGASGADQSFQVGDTVAVTFTVTKNDGSAWRLDEFTTGRIMLSGPTFNYQRVIPEQTDLVAHSTSNPGGSFTYKFASKIPATYAAPLNATASFGAGDGKLEGQALLAGTYTVGMYLAWSYTVDGTPFRDAGNATQDFLFGGATDLAPREVVKQDNCNQCHTSLRAHGGLRRDVRLCVLCHTSGAEDRNDPKIAGGTPGLTIDFRVMIHKIHNAAHLPSVLGVATNTDGSRNYAATPQPYQIAGGSSATDFSDVNFPVWPNADIAMPRDMGYTALTSGQQAIEDTIRKGAANCTICHGDPDGAGPLTAPAQGGVAYTQPSRRACGACHDDVDWTKPYTSNGMTMPPQSTDAACLLCHGVTSGAIAPQTAHVHPLEDPAFNPGLNVAITSVAEAGTNNGSGTIDPGEKIACTFRITDDSGADVAPSALASISVVVSGPTSNVNMLLNTSIPTAALTGSQPFTVNVPQSVLLERVGASTGVLETFTTALAPHWDVTGALTSVRVRTATGATTTLSASATAPQNYLDLTDATGFARNSYVVVDDAVSGKTEYQQIQTVAGNRIWFGSPASGTYLAGIRVDHAAAASVKVVTLTAKTKGVDFSLNASTGVITELVEFGAGNDVVVSYTTDFVMPSTYPVPLNGSPGFDESWGKWTGKSLVDGTYMVGLWGSRNLTLNAYGETNSYRGTSRGVRADFRVGSATKTTAYALISDGANCNVCHHDISFHGGGRRGFDACVMCHGSAGSEDRPQYVAPNAPDTPDVTINFRTMLHKIHRGAELANASSYTVVGFGSGTYPNNYGTATYEDVEFPAMPGGTLNCRKCHGTSDAWMAPSDRNHPTEQGLTVRAWTASCGSCHDSDAAAAHIAVQTSAGGVESCAVCHDKAREWQVQLMHKAR